MTRIKPPTHNRSWADYMPPADAEMSPRLRDLFAELVQLKAAYDKAATEAVHLRNNAAEDEAEAFRADVAAGGHGDVSATPNMDALKRRRQDAALQTKAAEAAIDRLKAAIAEARDEFAVSPEAEKLVASAAARVAKAGKAYVAALTEASATLGVVEWARDAVPYDATVLLPVADLGINGVIGRVLHDLPAGLDAIPLIEAITNTITTSTKETVNV